MIKRLIPIYCIISILVVSFCGYCINAETGEFSLINSQLTEEQHTEIYEFSDQYEIDGFNGGSNHYEVPFDFDPRIDVMGRTNWPSFSAARKYYGEDFTYYFYGIGGMSGCKFYYYCFEEGGRVFFGVR